MPNPPGLSQKDADQVLRAVMDDDTNRLRVDAIVSPDGHDLEINHVDDSIAIGTSTELFTATDIGPKVGLDTNVINTVPVSQSGSWTVAVNNFPPDADSLAQGSSTSGQLGSLVMGATTTAAPTYPDSTTNPLSITTVGALRTDSSATTQPISATSLPLPTGAATESTLASFKSANHTDLNTINTTLGSPMQNSGGSVTANAGSGTFLVDGSAHTQPISAVSLPLPTGASTEATLSSFKTANHNDLTTINTTLGSPMQNSGGSVTVNQGTSPWVVSGTVTTSPNVNVHDGAGVSISSTGSSLNVDVTNTVPVSQSGTWNVNNISGTVSLPTGAATNSELITINSTLGSPMQNSGGSVTANAGTNLNTSALALDTSVNGILVTQGSTTSGEKGPLIQGAVTTSAPTYTTAQTSPLSLTTAGALRTDASGTTQPISGTITANQGTSPWVVSGTVTANAGTGTFAVSDATTHTELTTINTTLGSPFQAGGSIGNTSFIATQTSGANLHVNVDNFPADSDALAQASTTAGQLGNLTMGAVTTSAPTYTTGQTDPLSLTTTGALRTDSSATTQPISGTITANQGTSPWVVSGTVTANAGTGTFLVDGSAHTQPVSGTVTANAGTGNFTVVQSSGTNLHVNVDNFPADSDALAQSSTTSGQLGALIMGAVTTAAPSYTTANTNPVSLTTSGLLRTDGSGVTQPISGTVAVTQSTSPWVVSGTVTASNFPTTVDTNYGTVGANTLRGAAQIGNATGAANFNAGATGAQTLRTVTNLNDGSANAITSTTINSKQRLDVIAASTTGVLTDRSGTTTTTSTQLAPANPNRQYFFIENHVTNAKTIFINFTAAATSVTGATSSISIVPGASFTMEGNFVSTEAINIISGTAGQFFTAKEG